MYDEQLLLVRVKLNFQRTGCFADQKNCKLCILDYFFDKENQAKLCKICNPKNKKEKK